MYYIDERAVVHSRNPKWDIYTHFKKTAGVAKLDKLHPATKSFVKKEVAFSRGQITIKEFRVSYLEVEPLIPTRQSQKH